MTVLLVGGTGFLGSHVAARLPPRDTVILVRPTSDRRGLPDGVALRLGDLDDPASLEGALKGVDTLVYCASMGFGHVPPLVPRLQAAGVARALFVSTTALFTRLPAPSRVGRLAAEQAVQASSLAWTIVRPTMIYGGERDRNVARLLRFLRRSPVFPIFGSGRALQQPVYVEDLADAVVAALASPRAVGRSYNLPGAHPLPYVDLVRVAARAVGRDVRLVHVPLRLAVAATRAVRPLPFGRAIAPEQVLRLAEDKAFDYAEARRDFGYHPRSFEEGVRLEAAALGLAPARPERG